MRLVQHAGLFLLLALAATATATHSSYRCTHGELWANRSGPPLGTAAPGPPAERNGSGGAFRSHVADLREWKRLRVATSFEDLNLEGKFCAGAGTEVPDFRGGRVMCGPDGILTAERRRQLLGAVFPAAVKLHTARLSVIPAEGPIKVEMMTAALLYGECEEFTVPAHHRAGGVGVDADFVLYVASSPARSFGSACAYGDRDRPVAGVVNFETPLISATRFATRVAAHEIAHALGFNNYGAKQLELSESMTRADGSTIFRALVSRSVKRAVRRHYGCMSDADAAMALEGKDWASYHALGTHWSQQNAKDELMAPRLDAAGGLYSVLTLAFFDDLPYYQADLSKAESMRWGKGLGCDFFRETCRRGDGAIARPDMYCDAPSATLQCAHSRLALGTCGGAAAATANKMLQGVVTRMAAHDGGAALPEYCDAVTAAPATSCIDGDAAQMPGSVVGPDSRCLRAESVALRSAAAAAAATRDICANVQCDADARRVRVQLKGSPAWHDCDHTLELVASPEFAAGRIMCPSYDEVCAHARPTQVRLSGHLSYAADGAATTITKADSASTITAHAVLLAVVAALALTIYTV